MFQHASAERPDNHQPRQIERKRSEECPRAGRRQRIVGQTRARDSLEKQLLAPGAPTSQNLARWRGVHSRRACPPIPTNRSRSCHGPTEFDFAATPHVAVAPEVRVSRRAARLFCRQRLSLNKVRAGMPDHFAQDEGVLVRIDHQVAIPKPGHFAPSHRRGALQTVEARPRRPAPRLLKSRLQFVDLLLRQESIVHAIR